MTAILFMRKSFVAIGLSIIFTSACAQAQSGKSEYQPQVGQEGKDVIWVPTPQSLVDKMLDMGKVTAKDYLIDLGSGDGRTVITAAKRGTKALGIEYNPDMVELSKRNAAKEGVTDKASFTKADLFESDFSQATVITMFLLPGKNRSRKDRLWRNWLCRSRLPWRHCVSTAPPCRDCIRCRALSRPALPP